MSDVKREKRRGWDDGRDAQPNVSSKKPKTEPSSNGDKSSTNGAGKSMPAKPAVSLDVLEKAKKALQLQKQLQEKLKKLPTLPKPAAPAARTTGFSAAAPVDKAPAIKPLLLDDQGREVDEHGSVVSRASKRSKKAAPFSEPVLHIEKASATPVLDAAPTLSTITSFDDQMGDRDMQRLQRRPRATFDFVQEGRFQKQAEMARLRSRFGSRAGKPPLLPPSLMKPSMLDTTDVNAIPLGQRTLDASARPDPIPDVEWWDARILQHESYEDVTGPHADTPLLRQERITALVEHPVLIDPPAEAPAPAPQPLKLTKKEMKKLRTQRRLQREQDKLLLIRQGLLEPPKPKVKISNLMRVLGSEATADPTAIEQEVRRQMEERQQAHEDRNMARMLTPAERREKKIRKMFDKDETGAKHVAVYRVDDLSHPQNRFKVDVNATENRFSGVCVIMPTMSVVVVEGCPKSHKRYEKLMLRRIDWSLASEDALPREAPNQCHLVWKGVVLNKAFHRFRVEAVADEEQGKRMLANAGVGHYFDLAKNFQPAA